MRQFLIGCLLSLLGIALHSSSDPIFVQTIDSPTFIQCDQSIEAAKSLDIELQSKLDEYINLLAVSSPNDKITELKHRMEKAFNTFYSFQSQLRTCQSNKYLGTSCAPLSSASVYLYSIQFYHQLIHHTLIHALLPKTKIEDTTKIPTVLGSCDSLCSRQQILSNRETQLMGRIDTFLEALEATIRSNEQHFKELGTWEDEINGSTAFIQSVRKIQFDFPSFRENVLSFISFPYEGSLLYSTIREIGFLEITNWYLDFIEEFVLNGS